MKKQVIFLYVILFASSLRGIQLHLFNSLNHLTHLFSSLPVQARVPAIALRPKKNAPLNKTLNALLNSSVVHAQARELAKFGFGRWSLVRNFIDKIASLSDADKVKLWNKWSTTISLSDPDALDLRAIMSAAIVEAIVPELISEKTFASYAKNPAAYAKITTVLPGITAHQDLFSRAIIQGIAALALAQLQFLSSSSVVSHEMIARSLPTHARIVTMSNNGEYVAWLDLKETKNTVSTLNISRFVLVDNKVRQMQAPLVVKAEMPQANFHVYFTESNGQVLIIETERADTEKTEAILFYNLDLQKAFTTRKVEKYQLARVNALGFKMSGDLVIQSSALSNCKKIIALGFANGLIQIYANNDATNLYELFKSYEIDPDDQFISLTYNDYDQSMYIIVQRDKKYQFLRYRILSDDGVVFEKTAQFDANQFAFLTLFGKDLIAVQETGAAQSITVLNGMSGATVGSIPLTTTSNMRTVQQIFADTKNHGLFFDRATGTLSVLRETISTTAPALYQIVLQAPLEPTGLMLDQALLVAYVFNNFVKNDAQKLVQLCGELKKIYEGLPLAVKRILGEYVEVCK